MALTALKGVKLKKRTARAKARSGINAAPVEKGMVAVKDFFQYEVDRKDILTQQKQFVKSNFNKTDAKYILANPEWNFTFPYRGAIAFWYNTGQVTTEKSEESKAHLIEKLAELRTSGKAIHDAKKLEAKSSNNVVTLSPQQRLQRKISNTIMQDLLSLEDSWIEGETASLDVYQAFGRHGLSGSATIPVRATIEGWLLDFEDAYHKRCEQAVEGYSHIKRPELNRRIKECKAMLTDLDRIKAAKKATRKSGTKVLSMDKQVARLKYKKEDNDFKIVSINPAQIVGKSRLLVFNTKYKMLVEYFTEAVGGFEIKGTTIKNFSPESREWKLRKPLDILPKALACNAKQFEKLASEFTTKPGKPNGRINENIILLKVLT
jgi:hypothetical protein